MKIFQIIFLLLISFCGIAQDTIQLRDPRDSYFKLDKGWIYKMGDLPATSIDDVNTSGWKPIDPASDIHDSIPDDAKTGVGWMRLYLKVDEQVRGKQMMLLILQSVASEVFLNGKLIKKYGIVSANPTEVKSFDPRLEPVAINFSADSIQILTVRFAVQQGARYSTYYGATNSLLLIRVMHISNAIKTYREVYMQPWSSMFMLGIIFMVFILHISFFLMYPEQKANLFFALAALSNLIANLIHNYYYYVAQADQKYVAAVLSTVFYATFHLLQLTSILTFLKKRTKTVLWIFGVGLGLGIFIAARWYTNGFGLVLIPWQLLGYAYIIVISYIAQKKQAPEARILTIGFSVSFLAMYIFLRIATAAQEDHLFTPLFNIATFYYFLFLLAPPASVSIFLAYDFARTSKRLQQKLDEVEILSEKNVAVEREKQDILASQNLQLESKVEERTAELNLSLNQLRATQAQLIQSEKMASLGELTAGIAHEIQNPLNFVNNFSEVNTELIADMKKEINAGNFPEVSSIADGLDANMQKIALHGKRADAIVKSMLQHSRVSSGLKEPTDINALADEYLRLSYHGIRARDKNFSAALHTEFDETIGNIKIISQDIGRVLLNIYNNAFYAVAERRRIEQDGYEPKVSVTSKLSNGTDEVEKESAIRNPQSVILSIADNGNGIPKDITDKIFQPFFTTKPTGEGSGLGLSLSYDIIKAHGGTLKVESKEKEFTRFTIIIPIG